MKTNFNKNTKYNHLIERIFNTAVEILEINEDVCCDVFFVNNHKIKSVNKKFRNVDKVTDVLSFPSVLRPEVEGMQIVDWSYAKNTSFDNYANCIFIGDIMMSLKVAKKQAKEYGHSIEREVGYLCLHGLLHLLGYDHIDDEDKKIMRVMEEKILAASADKI